MWLPQSISVTSLEGEHMITATVQVANKGMLILPSCCNLRMDKYLEHTEPVSKEDILDHLSNYRAVHSFEEKDHQTS